MDKLSLYSVKVRLAALIVLTMLLVSGLTLCVYQQGRKLIFAHMKEDLERIVNFIASDQEQLIDKTRQFLITLAQLPELQENFAPACPQLLLARLLEEAAHYGNLGVAGLDGNVACSATRLNPSTSFLNEPWFNHAVRSHGFAMGASRLAAGDRAVLTIGYEVTDSTGAPWAVVFAAVNPAHLSQLISNVQPQKDIELMMINQGGTVLNCAPKPERCLGESLQGQPLLAQILKQGAGAVELTGSDATVRLYAFTPLSKTVDTGLYVAMGVPVAALYSAAGTMLIYQFAGLWAVALLALLMVWFGSDRLLVKPVNIIAEKARRLAAGDLGARTGLNHQGGELQRLAGAFDAMAETLERRALQLQHYQHQLRCLAAQLSLAEEHERRRIAVDLHDRVGQLLATAKLELGLLKESEPGSRLAERIDAAGDLIQQAMEETRTLIFTISSPLLYELGLEAALEDLAERVEKQHGISSAYADDGQAKPLEPDVRVLLFRAAGELLVNVVKHAGARSVRVGTRRDGDRMVVTIEDDGIGFDLPEPGARRAQNHGYGLFSIRERLSHVGGRLMVESRPGNGSRLTLVAPLSASTETAGDARKHQG
jgi:signal transduction histidine kinase